MTGPVADVDLIKAARPRVWWSPTVGLVQELPARWPGDVRVIRDVIGGHYTDLPDDAVEMVPPGPVDRMALKAVLAEHQFYSDAVIAGHKQCTCGITFVNWTDHMADALVSRGVVTGQPNSPRCASCEHRMSMHSVDGCVQEIDHGPDDEPMCCPCAVTSSPGYLRALDGVVTTGQRDGATPDELDRITVAVDLFGDSVQASQPDRPDEVMATKVSYPVGQSVTLRRIVEDMRSPGPSGQRDGGEQHGE